MAKQRSLDEQLAETQARQDRIKARLATLEARRKARNVRIRAKAEKVLVKVVLDAALSHNEFREVVAGLVANADLKPEQREAVDLLLTGAA
jgi:DNA-binding protein YbaB